MRLRLLGTLAVAMCAAGLTTASAAFAPAPSTQPVAGSEACSHDAPRGDSRVTLKIDGVTRTAIVHVPRSAQRGRELPVVLALHGSRASGEFMERYSGLGELSDRAGFVGVFPTADPRHGNRWSMLDGAPYTSGEVKFINALLDKIEDTWCVDADRAYATGVSNGGGMVAKLGCELSDRLAAIAPVAGGYSQVRRCRTGRPVSVLEVHGTEDWAVPYAGRGPQKAGAVGTWLSDWRSRDRCTDKPLQGFIRAGVERFHWSQCAGGTVVRHLKLYGGHHSWPGANPSDPGPQFGLSAAREVWRFFAPLRRRPA